MTTVTNIAAGDRGIWTTKGLVMLAPGQSEDLDLAKGADEGEWFKFGGAAAKDQDDDELPGLAGKNKDELIAIAEAEGVALEDDMTNKDIRSAIELHREG